jgi:hypothetical protein
MQTPDPILEGMVSDTGNARVNDELQQLREAMERELRFRQRMNWGISLIVLALSIVIAGIGASRSIDLNALLGEWRAGVVVSVGAALLFSFTILLQRLVQGRSRSDLDFARALSNQRSQAEGADKSGAERPKSTSLPIDLA